MSRVVVAGGRVFDGTGDPVSEGDVAIESGRIVEVGTGLDGDEVVDATGKTILPGLFDCHVHVILSHIDVFRLLQTPLSYRFYEAARNLQWPFSPWPLEWRRRNLELNAAGPEPGQST